MTFGMVVRKERKRGRGGVLLGATALGTVAGVVLLLGSQAQAQTYPPYSVGPSTAQRAPAPDFDLLDDDNAPPPVRRPRVSPGPILSPDDPRYGAPNPYPPGGSASAQPGARNPGGGFIYPESDQRAQQPYPQASQPQPYPQAGNDPNRPPAAVGSTGSAGGNASAPNASATKASVMALPDDDQPETGTPKELPSHLRRQEVDYPTKEAPGTIIVDTANTQLYYVLGGGRAIRYGIRVGRDGFRWDGMQKITRKVEWPDWHPPTEMIERQPYLPRFMAGGPGNPLGARALYLGSTVYRIHGTNQPSTIGKRVSSGCFGLLNEDVEDLYDRVKVGTKVVVLPGRPPAETASADPALQGQGGPQNLAPPAPVNGGQSLPPNGQSGYAPQSGGGGAISSSPLAPPRQ